MWVQLSDNRLAALRRAIETERGDWAYQVCVDLARDIEAAERDNPTDICDDPDCPAGFTHIPHPGFKFVNLDARYVGPSFTIPGES